MRLLTANLQEARGDGGVHEVLRRGGPRRKEGVHRELVLGFEAGGDHVVQRKDGDDDQHEQEALDEHTGARRDGGGLLHELLVRIRRICKTEMAAQKRNRTMDHALEYPTRNFSNPWEKMPYSSVNVPYPGPPRVSV